jgi:hypothetical protein
MANPVSDAEVAAALDAILKPAADEVRPPFWEQAVSDSNAFAYGVCTSILAGRGLSLTQVLTWSNLRVAILDMALWRLATLGVIATDLSKDAIDKLDRRQELKEDVIVGPDGLPIVPELPPVSALGGVGRGACFSTRERLKGEAMRTRSGAWRKF